MPEMNKFDQRLLNSSRFFGLSALFFLPISVGLVNTFAALFALSVFINRHFWRDLADLWSMPAVRAALLLLSVLLMATLYSSAPLGAAFDFATKYRKLLFIPLLVWAFRDPAPAAKARWTLLASLSLVLLLSYTNDLGWTDRFHPAGYVRGLDKDALVFHERITQGFFMVLLFCIALSMLRAESRKILKCGLGLVAALAAVNVMFLVDSRTGQLCLVVIALWILLNQGARVWSHQRHRSVVIMVTGLVVITGLLVVSVQQKSSRLTTLNAEIAAGSETSAGTRLESIALSWKIIKAHPLFGTGTGSAGIESDRLRAMQQTTLTGTMTHPHNEYLSLMIQTGLPGLLLFLWLLSAVYIGARNLPQVDRDILQSYVIIFALGCLVNPFLLDFNEGHMFVFLSGILLGPAYRPAAVDLAGDIRKRTDAQAPFG